MKPWWLIPLLALLLIGGASEAQAQRDPRATPKGPRRIFPALPLAGVPRSAPANDNFADATAIALPLPFSATVGSFNEATGEASEPDDCFSDTASVWFTFTPDADMSVTLDTEGSTFDTVLGIYTGSALGALTLLRCNDDFSVQVDAGFASTVTGLDLTAATTYVIRVGAFDNLLLLPGDSTTLNVRLTPPAGSFAVNSTADAVDAAIGDGVCLTSGSVCTLRAAVNEANASQPGSTITLPAGTYVIAKDAPVNPENPNAKLYDDAAVNGDLDIVTGVTITGAGALSTVVDGGDLDTVFEFFAGANVNMSGLTIRNGKRPGNQSAGGGLRLNETAVVSANSIWITANEAVFGGGLTVEGGALLLTDSAITGNTATGRTFDNSPSPNTYIAGNGGGIEVRDNLGQNASITLINVTISGNTAVAPDASVTARGGGVYFGVPVANLDVLFNNVTIAANTASRGGGVHTDMPAADIVTRNTLIGDNAAPVNPDCKGDIGSTGSNFVENAAGCTTAGGDTTGQDPFLNPLNLNAPGATPTHLPRNASAARDNGNAGTCAAADQRGIARPQGAACDIGALEALIAVPGAFGLIAPANSAVFVSSTGLTALTWHPSANAQSYSVKIEDISAGAPVTVFTQNVAAAPACGVECTIPFAESLPDGFYRFSVVAGADTATTAAAPMHLFQVDSVAGLPNLIANAGFETSGKKGQPANWKYANLSGDKRRCNTLDETVAYDGVCAYMFKGSSSESTVLKQKVNKSGLTLAEGDTFRLTYFVSAGSVNAAAQIKVIYKKQSIKPSVLKLDVPDGDGTYLPYTGEVELKDPRVEKVMVLFKNKSKKGKWYVDAVRVIYLSATTRATSASSPLPPPAAPEGFRGQN